MKDKVKSFRDLLVWQKSMALVTEIYKQSKTFPKDETYGLTLQMKRCAVSIPSNIAEGFGRYTTKDFIRFLRIAIGSLYELQTQIEISLNLGFLSESDFDFLMKSAREIEYMINSLTRKLHDKKNP